MKKKREQKVKRYRKLVHRYGKDSHVFVFWATKQLFDVQGACVPQAGAQQGAANDR
jgi:hypothetical protein